MSKKQNFKENSDKTIKVREVTTEEVLQTLNNELEVERKTKNSN